MADNQCKRCGTGVRNHNDSIMMLTEGGNYILLCLRCFNKEISEAIGIEFDEIDLQPILIKDADGIDHTFHFSVRLMEVGLVLGAFEKEYENRSEGYEFSIIGDVEDGVFPLFSRLYTRMCKALSRKHIYHDEGTNKWEITESDIVRGQITYDPDTDEDDWTSDPMIVIDGKAITLKEFGQMLKAFEGFNFKLQIFDLTDEMD
jgi:hypothetical protein